MTSAQRARVGAELRRIRLAEGLSGEDVGAALGWSQSKVSRIETGRFGVSIPDLSALLSYYGVPEEVKAELLSTAADDAGIDGAWIVRAGGTPRRQGEVQAVETQLKRFRQHHPLLVPGQLQSEEYARENARLGAGLTRTASPGAEWCGRNCWRARARRAMRSSSTRGRSGTGPATGR
ncbi:hypothetical protein Athai_54500 [Actinocatenispora thailandica]|uniref:HTH cro/C1-type domain-containing protein n=1 Tax=Actinocatenispora thailandica TaxID=227318 RepID=A0A7R7DU92_9ACTN|nr:helix-turn-helix transcriptional regulator [Actinocatenispora thailandica]BCJ37947.1 hypothetical protein Athai_54500 [Actinocatenispora thailandica]